MYAARSALSVHLPLRTVQPDLPVPRLAASVHGRQTADGSSAYLISVQCHLFKGPGCLQLCVHFLVNRQLA